MSKRGDEFGYAWDSEGTYVPCIPPPPRVPTDTMPSSGNLPDGRKDDTAKPRWDLLPFGAVSQIVDVLTFGAKKYAPDNWRHVPEPRRRYYAAMLRHTVAWWLGERCDKETGLSHLAHAGACLLFLLARDDE